MTNTQALQRTLGERLVKVRRVNGNLTQQQMADRLGIGKRNLVRYENDEALPGLDVLARYRDAFEGVTISWLVGEDGTLTDALTAGEGHLAPVYMMPSLFDSDDYLMAA